MTHLSRLLDNAGIPEDLKRQIREAVEKDCAADKQESAKFKNGLNNILNELSKAPGLPIESLRVDEQAIWTDTITGILMALGPYAITGRPETIWEHLVAAQEEA